MIKFNRSIKELAVHAPISERTIQRTLEGNVEKQTAVICGVRIFFCKSTNTKRASYLISEDSYLNFIKAMCN